MPPTVPDTDQSRLTVNVYDGTRSLIKAGTSVLYTIIDGNQKQQLRKSFPKWTVNFNLPFYDNFGDNYTVIVFTDDYQQAGFARGGCQGSESAADVLVCGRAAGAGRHETGGGAGRAEQGADCARIHHAAAGIVAYDEEGGREQIVRGLWWHREAADELSGIVAKLSQCNFRRGEHAGAIGEPAWASSSLIRVWVRRSEAQALNGERSRTRMSPRRALLASQPAHDCGLQHGFSRI